MSTDVRGGGFGFRVVSVGGNWEWDVTASNVRGSGQLYQVENIRTPFGPLCQVNIPLPGDVVTAMAESLMTLQQQLQPQILLSSGTAFSLTVTEGDGVLTIGSTVFSNIGAFGSFMSVAASPSASWLSADPATVAGINKNATGQATLRIDPRIMLAASSPYSGSVAFADNAGHTLSATVSVTVLPRPSIVLSSDEVVLAYSLSSMVASGSVPVVITNGGSAGSILGFALSKVLNTSPWLSFLPTTGSNIASSGTANVTFSLVGASVPQLLGTYTETVRVSSPNASNGPQDITVTVQVNP